MKTLPIITITACLLLNALAINGRSKNETAARIWIDDYVNEYQKVTHDAVEANWAYQINMKLDTERANKAAKLRLNKLKAKMRREMDSLFDWPEFKNETLKRMFFKTVEGISHVTDVAKETLFYELVKNMTQIKSTATIKMTKKEREIFQSSSPDDVGMRADPSTYVTVKKNLWQRFQDAQCKPVRATFLRYVDLANEMIKHAGYDNYAQYWQSMYEPKPDQNFEKMMADIFEELLPFYQELHGYVRHALKQKYPAKIFPPTDQIPNHILNELDWQEVEPFSKPFPNENAIDITKEMEKRKWTVKKIFETSENFFDSLGLGKMTPTFWKKSIMEQIKGVKMRCHPSAWDFKSNNGDFRIKQCTEVNSYFFRMTHHEMGHIQYFKQYEKQPIMFRESPNPGFHEAIGDTIELSVMTPSHLRKIGLLSSDSMSEEFYINYLYLMALTKVVHIPYAYMVDHWRYKVFKGQVPKIWYNTEWQSLECKLLGRSSPMLRTELDFDPAVFNPVVANTEYMKYFVSHVLQFQLHKSLCKAAGVTENIYKCSIYNNSAAGAKLKALLEKGSSVHWEDALFEISGTRKISAQPLLGYFEPLRKHIREVNAKNGVTPGWNNDCPSVAWYKSDD